MPQKDERSEADDPRRLLTMQDVADRLHKSKRWLQDWMRGQSYGVLAGRTRLFTEEDFAAIVNALRVHSVSSRRHRAGARSAAFEPHTAETTLAEALRLASKPTRKKEPK